MPSREPRAVGRRRSTTSPYVHLGIRVRDRRDVRRPAVAASAAERAPPLRRHPRRRPHQLPSRSERRRPGRRRRRRRSPCPPVASSRRPPAPCSTARSCACAAPSPGASGTARSPSPPRRGASPRATAHASLRRRPRTPAAARPSQPLARGAERTSHAEQRAHVRSDAAVSATSACRRARRRRRRSPASSSRSRAGRGRRPSRAARAPHAPREARAMPRVAPLRSSRAHAPVRDADRARDSPSRALLAARRSRRRGCARRAERVGGDATPYH